MKGMAFSRPSLSSPFQKLLLVYILWNAAWMPVSSLLYVYFSNSGMQPTEIFFVAGFIYLGALLTIPLFRSFTARDFIIAGVALSAVSVAALFALPMPLAAYANAFICGTTYFIFWAPFNVLFYEFRKDNNAQLGALYFSVGPVLSLVLPVLGGWLAQSFGYIYMFALSLAIFAVCAAAALAFVENRRYSCGFMESLRAISGLRTIIFMEGFAAMAIVSVTLGVMLLHYADQPLEFGIFIAMVTVFSVAASVLAAQFSDHLHRRREPLLALVALFAISAIFTSQVHIVGLFLLGYGLVNFFSRIFFPLPLALAVDNSRDLAATMVGREIMLNLGRLSGVMAGCFILIFLDFSAVLLFEGLALLLYIPVFENRKKKLQRC